MPNENSSKWKYRLYWVYPKWNNNQVGNSVREQTRNWFSYGMSNLRNPAVSLTRKETSKIERKGRIKKRKQPTMQRKNNQWHYGESALCANKQDGNSTWNE